METSYILETFGICKNFSGVPALDDISIKIKKGDVHAFLGENGAGKSTLVKILSGAYPASSGYFHFAGRDINYLSPREAQEIGISIVHQELNLFPELSITENIFLGRELTGACGKIAWAEMHKNAERLLETFQLDFDVRTKISALSVAEQQMVEMVKCLSIDASLIILDEPTDVLTDSETKKLFSLIKRLKEEGKTIIYISHRLDELRRICDTFTVFRDGKHVFTGVVAEHSKDEIVQMMVARKLTEQYPRVEVTLGDEALRVRDLCLETLEKGVSFSARKREILGFYGLVGSGRTELMRAVIGADPKKAGETYIEGKPIEIKSPKTALKNGIVYITESRKEFGLMLDMSVTFNISLSILNECLNIVRGIDGRKEKAKVDDIVERLSIKTPDTRQLVRKLSGGNQQKVLLARCVLTKPKIMIIDEPTRGVDVGAKVSIYQILNHLKQEGVAIIMISSDMPEILGISDRVAVMHDGYVTGFFTRANMNEESIAACAFGKNEGV
ncbi:MAG: sugar ABC transporter ATP-binding protein [Synergistaceae bacterium]|nr:sugar ABC transporter ATP-binding protein [Synergistaceae bacterium]